MKILPVHREIIRYLQAHGLLKKFEKQIDFFVENPFHPSLDTELLEPKDLRIWSFRVDRKYRAIFIFRSFDTVEIIEINNHYK